MMLLGTQRINSKGRLEIGGVDTVDLARDFGTPLYVMDEETIRKNARDYLSAFKDRYPNESGDILAVQSTGAYNFVMASNYNRLRRPAVVLVNKGQADLLVKRETYEDLVQRDVIPERFL